MYMGTMSTVGNQISVQPLYFSIQTRNERLFLVTILIMNTATNRQKLENAVFQTCLLYTSRCV